MDVLVVHSSLSQNMGLFCSYVSYNVMKSLVFLFIYLHTILRLLEVDNADVCDCFMT